MSQLVGNSDSVTEYYITVSFLFQRFFTGWFWKSIYSGQI